MLLTAAFALVLSGCGNNGAVKPPPEDKDTVGITFPSRVRKTDGQFYTAGKVQYPDSLWTAPKYEYDPELDSTVTGCEGVKAFFMDSPITHNGKQTKIMGYIGFPDGASASSKVPGIVLVPGSGASASADWVKLWNDHGYAAVVIDVEGGQAQPECSLDAPNLHMERNKYYNGAIDPAFTAGPSEADGVNGNRFYFQSPETIGNFYMYHATSAVILANSLLRADPRVDENKVGITGISGGGIICSILIGYDDRYAFAMPVYGNVTFEGTAGWFNSFGGALYKEAWGDLGPLQASKTPVLWMNGDKDAALGLDGTIESYDATQNGFLVIKPAMPHGMRTGAEQGELFVFADAVTGRDNQIIKITEPPLQDSAKFTYRIGFDVTVNSISLYYTSDLKLSSAVWQKIPIDLPQKEYTVEFTYPETAKYCYININYNYNLAASCPLVRFI